MSERTYYVMCEDNCKFEGMTKEQIIAAIAEATGATPTQIDDAFITKLKEQNANTALKMWVGTQAQYNAIATPDSNTLYIISDDDFRTTVLADISALETSVDALDAAVEAAEDDIDDLETAVSSIQTNTVPAVTELKNKYANASEALATNASGIGVNTTVTNAGKYKLMTVQTAIQIDGVYEESIKVNCISEYDSANNRYYIHGTACDAQLTSTNMFMVNIYVGKTTGKITSMVCNAKKLKYNSGTPTCEDITFIITGIYGVL